MKKSLLEDIGLTKSEISVYLALLELGSSTTGKIVDKAKVSSSKIYEVLDKLIQKGLVSFIIKSGIKYFQASSPERIMGYMEEKENKLSEQKNELEKLLPELKIKQTLSKYNSEATIFKGIEGAKTAFDDVLTSLNKGEEYYVMGASELIPSFSIFIRQHHMKRIKKGIGVKLLFSEQAKDWVENLKDIKKLTEIKFAPSQLLASSFILIYKNKILITVISKRDITMFRIESKEVTDSFKSQFELLWTQETTTYKGLEGNRMALERLVNSMKKGDEWLAYVIPALPKKFTNYLKLLKGLHKWRDDKGLRSKLIFTLDNKKEGKIREELSNTQVKYIPKLWSTAVIINVAGNNVVLNIPTKDFTAIYIENKFIADSFKSRFNQLWKRSK